MNQTNQKNKVLEMYILLVVDLVAIIGSYLLALLARYGHIGRGYMNELHFSTCLCFLLVSVIYSLVLDWNREFIKRGYLVEAVAILKYNLVMVVVVATILFMTSKAEPFSRMVWGYVFVFNTMLTFAAHLAVKRVLKEYYRTEHCRVKVMVVADAVEMPGVLEKLEKGLPVNYDVTSIAVFGGKMENDIFYRDFKLPVYEATEAEGLIEQVKQLPLDEVFLHVSDLKGKEVQELIRSFESMGIICHYSVEIAEWNEKESSIGKFADYTVVSYSIYKIDYRRRLIKRMMDIAGGIVGMLITAVLSPFIAIAIKCNSKGPVLFSQVRVGKNGRRFRLYKFRSMYMDAEDRKKELEMQNEMSGYMFKLDNDPRITSVGRFLRKTSLDELPQFYNILRGDMSLIGTRPPTEDEFEQYSPYYRRRLCMTPGLTGLWQVSGRSEINDFDQVVQLDLQYIDNWSLTLDIKILFKTIWVVFTGKGAK